MSMEDTLFKDEYFVVNNNAYSKKRPVRNDMLVFLYPQDKKTTYIKRCVGLPGDTIDIIDKILYVNHQKAQEPSTIKHIDTLNDGSHDSRYYGSIPFDLIIGKANLIFYSHDFDRIGQDIH